MGVPQWKLRAEEYEWKRTVWRSKVPLRDIAMTLAVLGCHASALPPSSGSRCRRRTGTCLDGRGMLADPGDSNKPGCRGSYLRRSIACTWTPGEFGLPELRRNALLVVSLFLPGVRTVRVDLRYDLYRELTLGATYGGTVTDGLLAAARSPGID